MSEHLTSHAAQRTVHRIDQPADGTTQHVALTSDGQHDIRAEVRQRDFKSELLESWEADGTITRLGKSASALRMLMHLLARARTPLRPGVFLLDLPAEDELLANVGLKRSAIYAGLKELRTMGVLTTSKLGGRHHLLCRCEHDARAAEMDDQPGLYDNLTPRPAGPADTDPPRSSATGEVHQDGRESASSDWRARHGGHESISVDPAPSSPSVRTDGLEQSDRAYKNAGARAKLASFKPEASKLASFARDGVSDKAGQGDPELADALDDAGIDGPLRAEILAEPGMTAAALRRRITIDTKRGKGPALIGKNALTDVRRDRRAAERKQRDVEQARHQRSAQQQADLARERQRRAEHAARWETLGEPLRAIVDRLRAEIGEHRFNVYFQGPDQFKLYGHGTILVAIVRPPLHARQVRATLPRDAQARRRPRRARRAAHHHHQRNRQHREPGRGWIVNVTDPEFQRLFIAELQRLQSEVDRGERAAPTIEFSYDVLASVIGQLQLALRHPNNTGPSADLARRVVYEVVNAIDSQPVRRGLMAGFNPLHDQPRGNVPAPGSESANASEREDADGQ